MTNRVRRTTTEPRIRAALTELLAERELGAISVSDITRRAGINRGTFYAHYVDKHDLVQQLIDGVLDDLANIVLGEDDEAAGESAETVLDTADPIPFERVHGALIYVRDHYVLIARSPATEPTSASTNKQRGLSGSWSSAARAVTASRWTMATCPRIMHAR